MTVPWRVLNRYVIFSRCSDVLIHCDDLALEIQIEIDGGGSRELVEVLRGSATFFPSHCGKGPPLCLKMGV